MPVFSTMTNFVAAYRRYILNAPGHRQRALIARDNRAALHALPFNETLYHETTNAHPITQCLM
jgi:hypothetical protein